MPEWPGVVEDTTHRRFQLQHDGYLRDFMDGLFNVAQPAFSHHQCEAFYYFNETYCDYFDHHLQVDLFVSGDGPIEAFRDAAAKEERSYYEETDFGTGWWGNNEWERELLMQGHRAVAPHALWVLAGRANGDTEHTLRAFAARRWHLIANQYGLSHRDELAISVSKTVRLFVLIVFGERVFKWVFNHT